MNPRSLALAALAVVLAAAVWWTLRPPAAQERDASRQTAAEAAVERDSVDAAATPPADTPTREEVAADEQAGAELAGHRIQILDVDGRPAAGVPLGAWSLDTPEETRALVEGFAPGEILASPGGGTRSDEEGYVALSVRAHCVVSAVADGRAGSLYCPPIPDGEASPVHVLQLVEVPMVEVIVQDAQGQPVPGRLDFDAYSGNAAAVKTQPEGMDVMAYDSAWGHRPNAIFELPDGRRMFELTPNATVRKRPQGATGPYRHRLILDHGGTRMTQEFDDEVTGPIVFQLAAQGSILLHLNDFPFTVMPSLREKLSDDRRSRGVRGERVDEHDPTRWRFDEMPVGKSWEVVFHSQADERSPYVPTYLPARPVSGPVTSGEVVEQTLDFVWPPGFHGRLTAPPEVAETWTEFIAGRSRGRADAMLFFDSGDQVEDWARLGVLPSGHFHVPLDFGRPAHHNTGAIDGLGIDFRESRSDDASDDRGPVRLWAFVDARLPAPDARVDLGEITLQHEDPLLKVRVLDQNGQPLAGARIDYRFAGEWSVPGVSSDEFFPASRRPDFTDACGEAWVIARDWYAAVGRVAAGTERQPRVALRTIRCEVTHEAGEASHVDVPVGARVAEVRLRSAGRISGSVLPVTGSERLQVTVRQPGQAIDDESGAGIHPQPLRFDGDDTPAAFTLAGVPRGSWDVVITSWAFSKEEVLRIPGVQVDGSGEVRDPRLQRIDLAPHVAPLRLRLFDSGGQRLDALTMRRADLTLRMHNGRGGTSGQRLVWEDDELVILLPRGVDSHVSLTAEGWAPADLARARPGTRDVHLRKLVAGRVRVTNFAELPDGVELHLTVAPPNSRAGQAPFRRRLASAEAEIHWPESGEYRVLWRLGKPSVGWRETFGSTLEVSEDQAASGGVVSLSIPPEALDAIPR